jgi:hypothetical protein
MGNKRIKKNACHSTLVLERLFKYMFQKDSRVTYKKTKTTQKKTKITKEEMQQVWIIREEHQGDLHGRWKKEKIELRLEKDQSRDGSQGKMLDLRNI